MNKIFDNALGIIFLLVALIACFILGSDYGRATERQRWLTWECSKANGELVRDNICIRTDTSFRILIPIRK